MIYLCVLFQVYFENWVLSKIRVLVLRRINLVAMFIQVYYVFDVRRLQLGNNHRDVIFFPASPFMAVILSLPLKRRKVLLVLAALLRATRETLGRFLNIWLGEPPSPSVPFTLPSVGTHAPPSSSLNALHYVHLIHVVEEAVAGHHNHIVFLDLVLGIVSVGRELRAGATLVGKVERVLLLLRTEHFLELADLYRVRSVEDVARVTQVGGAN